MYFTNRMTKKIVQLVKTKNYDVYAIKLKIGIADIDEKNLEELVDAMFRAWGKMRRDKNKNYLKFYDGIIKRLFFKYSEKDNTFEPFFYLLCLRKKIDYEETEAYKIRILNEKIRVQTYIRWFSTWASALKMCSPVSVGFSLVELENLEKVLEEFCTNEKYTLFPLIDEAKRSFLKKASGDGKHKLVTFGGIFKDMNRQMSVER